MSMTNLLADPGFRELVDHFVGDLPRRLSDMRAAVAEGQTEEVQRFAHQLKGAGGGFGFGQITRAAWRVEKAASIGTEPATLNTTIDDLDDVCVAVREDWVA